LSRSTLHGELAHFALRPGDLALVLSDAHGVDYWINKGHVSLLRHALRVSKASGVPIEEFVDEEDDKS
jgi:hypothetical protein